jgi:hypothetical protein
MQQIYDYSPSGSSEVSSIADSFGSVCVDTNSGTGNTQVPSTDHSYLVNLPVLNGIATINDLATFGMTLSSSGSTTNPWASAYSDVRETMYAQPDTRTVTLHRTGATGETTDLDSTVHGDTIYSTTNYNWQYNEYNQIIADPGTWTPNWQVYEPNYIGNWGWVFGQDHWGHSEDVPNAGFTWSPNESQDTWDWGTVEAPAGNITYQNGTPKGSPTGPSMQTVSYTAISNVDGAQATANYDITYHDPFEIVSDTKTNAVASGPLYGSDPNASDNTLDIVWGYAAAGTFTISKGSSSSQGLEIGGALSPSWLELLGVECNVAATSEVGQDTSQSSTFQFTIPAGDYTYPMFTATYVRNTVLYRQWGSAGELTVNAQGQDAPATETFDQYAGSDISWAPLKASTVPVPTQDPNPIPIVATPAAGE